MFQERLPTLSIRYIKSDKVRQTNCNGFLDNFVMKRAGQNLLQLFTVLCSALLNSMKVAFYFFIRISIMTAKQNLNQSSRHCGYW